MQFGAYITTGPVLAHLVFASTPEVLDGRALPVPGRYILGPFRDTHSATQSDHVTGNSARIHEDFRGAQVCQCLPMTPIAWARGHFTTQTFLIRLGFGTGLQTSRRIDSAVSNGRQKRLRFRSNLMLYANFKNEVQARPFSDGIASGTSNRPFVPMNSVLTIPLINYRSLTESIIGMVASPRYVYSSICDVSECSDGSLWS